MLPRSIEKTSSAIDQWEFTFTDSFSGKLQSLADVIAFQVWVRLEDFFLGHPFRHHAYNGRHWYPQASNTRQAIHLFRINCDPLELHGCLRARTPKSRMMYALNISYPSVLFTHDIWRHRLSGMFGHNLGKPSLSNSFLS